MERDQERDRKMNKVSQPCPPPSHTQTCNILPFRCRRRRFLPINLLSADLSTPSQLCACCSCIFIFSVQCMVKMMMMGQDLRLSQQTENRPNQLIVTKLGGRSCQSCCWLLLVWRNSKSITLNPIPYNYYLFPIMKPNYSQYNEVTSSRRSIQ